MMAARSSGSGGIKALLSEVVSQTLFTEVSGWSTVAHQTFISAVFSCQRQLTRRYRRDLKENLLNV